MTKNEKEFFKAYEAKRRFTGDSVQNVYILPNNEAIIEVYNNRYQKTYFSRAHKDATGCIICCYTVYHNFYECMEKEIISSHKTENYI